MYAAGEIFMLLVTIPNWAACVCPESVSGIFFLPITFLRQCDASCESSIVNAFCGMFFIVSFRFPYCGKGGFPQFSTPAMYRVSVPRVMCVCWFNSRWKPLFVMCCFVAFRLAVFAWGVSHVV